MKILIVDIETFPNTAHTWGLWQQNVGLNQLMESGRIACWAAKWHNEKPVHFASEHTDGRTGMLEMAWDLFNDADVVVGWNSKRFDVPWLQGEWARDNLNPPSPYSQIDLCDVVKRQFKLPSNKLDYVAGALLGEHKLSTGGHGLWVACMNGDEKAWATMRRYNIADVKLTDKLLGRLKPWVKDWPNPALYGDTDGSERTCPACGSPKVQARGRAYTKLSSYPRYQCTQCGRWSRGANRVEGVNLR